MNIIISGTENSCGKTVIVSGIASVMQSLGYKTSVYKPIQTGAIDRGKYLISPDLAFVKIFDKYIKTHSSYMLKSKTIPALGAAMENVDISIEKIIQDYNSLAKKSDIVITELTGGLMTPLKKGFYAYEIPKVLKLPVLFVVTPSTNNLNNLLNEINTAKSTGLGIAGVIVNKYPPFSETPEIKAFPALIEEYSDAKVLGIVRNFKGKSVEANVLFNEILNGIDIEEVFGMKIPKLNNN